MSQSNSVELVQGEDKVITMLFKESDLPFDLTGATEITARFPGANAAIVKSMTGGGVAVLNAPGGKVTVTLGDADTALLKVGERMGFEVIVDIGATRRIFQFDKSLTVRKRLVP